MAGPRARRGRGAAAGGGPCVAGPPPRAFGARARRGRGATAGGVRGACAAGPFPRFAHSAAGFPQMGTTEPPFNRQPSWRSILAHVCAPASRWGDLIDSGRLGSGSGLPGAYLVGCGRARSQGDPAKPPRRRQPQVSCTRERFVRSRRHTLSSATRRLRRTERRPWTSEGSWSGGRGPHARCGPEVDGAGLARCVASVG